MDKQETRLNVAWRREGRRAKDGEDLKAARDTGRSSPRENMCICEECGRVCFKKLRERLAAGMERVTFTRNKKREKGWSDCVKTFLASIYKKT